MNFFVSRRLNGFMDAPAKPGHDGLVVQTAVVGYDSRERWSRDLRNDLDLEWPKEGLRRVPYEVYRREDVYAQERERIFQGPVWNYLCLDIELPNPGDYRATFVGDVPVIVARHRDGTIHAFENRCLHRGAMLCLKPGNAKEISCVYHNWTYDLTGKLTGVAFQRGVNGKGGMPADFSIAGRHLRALAGRDVSPGWCSAPSPTRRRRSKPISGRRSPRASAA